MAITLGDIVFGIEANTKGLQRSINTVKSFGKVVSATARGQTTASKQSTAALVKQEAAALRAIRTVSALQKRIRSTGNVAFSRKALGQSSKALNRFVGEMASGTLGAKEFSRANLFLSTRLGTLKGGLSDVEAAAKRGGPAVGKMGQTIRNLESASVLAVGPLSGIGARIRALGAITGRSTLILAGIIGSVTAVGVAFASLIKNAIQTTSQIQGITSALSVATGSTSLARKEFDFIAQTALELGSNLAESAKEYAKLSAATTGTNITQKTIRSIFIGVSKAAAALNLTVENTSGVFRALQQIISKGNVQAEELRGQFGERIPGGFKLAADAIGVTTQELGKLTKEGKLTAEQLLPSLGKQLNIVFGPAAQRASSNLALQFERVKIQALLFNQAFDQAVGATGSFSNAVGGLGRAIGFLRDNMSNLFGVLGAIVAVLPVLFSSALIARLGTVRKLILSITNGIIAMNAALLANPVVGLASVLIRLVTVIGAATLGFLAFKNAFAIGAETTKEFIQSLEGFIEVQKRLRTASDATVKGQIKNTQDKIKAIQAEIQAQKLLVIATLASDDILGVQPEELGAVQKLKATDEALGVLIKRLGDLRRISTQPIGTGSAQPFTKSFDSAKEKVDALATSLNLAKGRLAAFQRGGNVEEQLQSLDAFAQSAKILKSVKIPAEIEKIRTTIMALGFDAPTASVGLQNLIKSLIQTKDAGKVAEASLKAVPEALKAAANVLSALERKNKGLRSGLTGFKLFEEQEAINEALRAFEANLIKAKVPLDQVGALTERYNIALKENRAAQRAFNEQKQLVEGIANAFDRGFGRIGASITEAFVKGEKAAITFQSVVAGVLSEIIQTIFQFTLLNPIKQGITGLLSAVLPGAPAASVQSGTANANIGAKGLAFAGGVKKFRKGGVLGGPTFFPSMGSGGSLGGEAGDEGLFPLKRMAGGNLGIEGSGGGGGGVVVNVFNNADSEVSTKATKKAGGGFEIDVTIDKSVGRAIRRGGSTFNAISDVFQVNPKTAGR